MRKMSIKAFTPKWYLDSEDDLNWSIFRNPRERATFQPHRMPRTLWSITRTHDEDGDYRGSVMIVGYEVIPQILKDIDNDFESAS